MNSCLIQMRLIAAHVGLEFWTVMISNFLAALFKSSGIAEAEILSSDDEIHPNRGSSGKDMGVSVAKWTGV
jgi:hypothetical protein